MKTDYANLGHKNDKELDVCECSDPMCPACYGRCDQPATETLYRVDMQDLTGTRLCADCANDCVESGLFTGEDEIEAY